MRHCIFCRRQVETVLWVYDGVSEYPVPACRTCTDKRQLRVYRIDPHDGSELPDRTICECCGRDLPSPDTWPVIVWVQDEHGLVAVCNACRVEYALDTVFTSIPRPRPEKDPPLPD